VQLKSVFSVPSDASWSLAHPTSPMLLFQGAVVHSIGGQAVGTTSGLGSGYHGCVRLRFGRLVAKVWCLCRFLGHSSVSVEPLQGFVPKAVLCNGFSTKIKSRRPFLFFFVEFRTHSHAWLWLTVCCILGLYVRAVVLWPSRVVSATAMRVASVSTRRLFYGGI